MTNIYSILAGKPAGKTPLLGTRCRWVDNIKINCMKIICEVVGWIQLAQDRI
jgi:hypothetical protein